MKEVEDKYSWSTYSESNKPKDRAICLVRRKDKEISFAARYHDTYYYKVIEGYTPAYWEGSLRYTAEEGDMWKLIGSDE